ncbi:MAG: methylmalonyl Co-A mutase-associated GTPase MeaB [Alphaproteobacteria bacterium]|nr:methylmalonyl Co-A mutase-associated GTPase MeaB [Alphaproteobacteria bacterium]
MTIQQKDDDDQLRQAILAGDRRGLARGITLVESERADHQERAEKLVTALLPRTGQATRLGISGAPGVGKSTFVEAFGMHIVNAGHRVAVLAIDPSSRLSGGSILGDKTRMDELSRHPAAFVRPSAAGHTLGGVARRTREAILLCEAAGYDVVIVETVGVGQSEATVANMVDVFLLLIAPGGGDELQGIKRGIVELVDLIVVNKCDGDLLAAAGRIAADYQGALGLLRALSIHWKPEVVQCSALEHRGIDLVWEAVGRCADTLRRTGDLTDRRGRQLKDWLWQEVTGGIMDALRRDTETGAVAKILEQEVISQRLLPPAAARKVRESFFRRREPSEK